MNDFSSEFERTPHASANRFYITIYYKNKAYMKV